jgi:heterodisulfide reductase subunit A
MKLGVPGEDTLAGISSALDFLRDTKLDKAPDLGGKAVAVIGGGNVAIDAARSARRLGASQVHLVCLEGRAEMPAYAWEVDEAAFEGVEVHNGWGVVSFTGESAVATVQLKQCTSVFDADGRFNPSYDDAVRNELRCDAAIVAIGMSADTSAFPALAANGARRLEAAPGTFKTKVPGVFAAGDAVMGPTTIASAAGHGAQAAYLIDRYLSGLQLKGAVAPLPVVDKDEVLSRQHRYSRRDPLAASVPLKPSPSDFHEIEAPLSEDEVRAAASRCLDCGVCSECHQCLAACPAEAIDLDMRAEEEELDIGTVIISTGYKLFPADAKPQYGYGKYPNVITAMQMDRLLAPTRPYNTVLRPSDGKVPERIAYVMCTGSRDQTVGNPLCSKFCCMYSLKQNQLVLGALPLADVTVHYIDIRAAGKGYDEFFEQAKAMGTTFLKGRVSGITETAAHNLILRYEDIDNGGGAKDAEYDLVVLAVGVQPSAEAARLFGPGELALDAYGYMAEVDEDTEPAVTSIPGVFLAGSASGPKDIPESILHAGAAVMQAAAYLERRGAVA